MTVEEYLRTGFEDGDREFVDGEVVERKIGELPHAVVQRRPIVAVDAFSSQRRPVSGSSPMPADQVAQGIVRGLRLL